MTTALLTPWSQDQLQKREIQRLWPDVDHTLSRGALHSFSNASIRPQATLQGGSGIGGGGGQGNEAGPSRKRPRSDPQQPASTFTTPPQPVFSILEDGTLKKPSIPGVSPATIDHVIKDIRTSCRECAPCLLKASSGRRQGRETNCITVKAVKAWESEFGGVSYSKAEEIAKGLAQPLFHGRSVWRNRKRSGVGLRCEACRACKSEAVNRCKCNFVKAISSKTLPERLKPVVEAAEAAVLENLPPSIQSTVTAAAAAANQISLEQYIKQMPGMDTDDTEGTVQTGIRHSALVESEPDARKERKEHDDDEDDDENLRWAGWAPFLSHPEARKYTTTTASTSAALGSIGSGGGDRNVANNYYNLSHLSTKQQVRVLSQRLGVEPESLIDWICTARIVVKENIQNEEKEEEERTALNPASDDDNRPSGSGKGPLAEPPGTTPLTTTECGHVNSRNIFHCESCNTARWSGPVGQLSTRIISALQSGILSGTAGRSTVDIDSELASTVAARIAAEAGPGAEELPEMDDLMEEVYCEIRRVRTAAAAAAAAAKVVVVVPGQHSGTRGSTEKEEHLKGIGGIVRRTKMAKSVVTLENSIGRLVEEQTALLTFGPAKKIQKINERRGERKKSNGVLDSIQRKMEEVIKLRTMLLEAKDYPFDWGWEEEPAAARGAAAVAVPSTTTTGAAPPSSSKRQRSGKSGGASGVERPIFLGYSAFSQRIVRCLRGVVTSSRKTPLDATEYQSLCEILFTSTPPSCSSSFVSTPSSTFLLTASEGWTEGMVAHVEYLLQNVEATKQLMLASQIGGPGSLFKHVLWALLQRQQQQRRSEREAAAAQGAGGGDGYGSQPENPSQSLNPFLVSTQQSQPEGIAHPLSQSQPQSQSQGATAAAAEASGGAAALNATPISAEFNSSIALLDDLINSIDTPSTDTARIITTTSAVEKEEHADEEEERFDQHRFNVMNHITSTTLQCIYTLTHSVLNTVAQKEARTRMPVHLTPFVKTILEYAQFPNFPPLPPPPLAVADTPTTTTATTTGEMVFNRFNDIHDIMKPIPDSRHPVQDMVKGIRPRRGRLQEKKMSDDDDLQKQLPQARPGGFSAWNHIESIAGRSSAAATAADPVPSGAEGGVERKKRKQQTVITEVIPQCPVDVQVVFSEAINSGIRPELVYKAALRYLETVGRETNKDG